VLADADGEALTLLELEEELLADGLPDGEFDTDLLGVRLALEEVLEEGLPEMLFDGELLGLLEIE
jgi:hypothetical protein